jgi:acyl-CoA thioester hydrolase
MDQSAFQHEIAVEEADIDMLGHASNVAFVRWIQDVAVAHSGAVGYPLPAFLEKGAFFVVRRHEVDYLRPVLRGESLVVRTWIESAAAAKCERVTEIARLGPAGESELVASARTTWGYVEATTGRPVRIHEEVRAAFGMPPRKSSAPPPPSASPAPSEEVSS